MTTLLLIRHGTTQSNLERIYQGFSEEDLHQEGKTQVKKLVSRLKKIPIQAIYASPLKRTSTTAQGIAESHDLPLNIWQDLTEINLGRWEGCSHDEVQSQWPELWEEMLEDPGPFIPPNGEAFQSVLKRSVKALNEIIKKHPNQCVALVTHDIIIKILIIHTLQATTKIYHHFRIDCTSVSKVIAKKGKLTLISMNDTSHLDISSSQ